MMNKSQTHDPAVGQLSLEVGEAGGAKHSGHGTLL